MVLFNRPSIFVPYGPRILFWIIYPNEILISKHTTCSIVSGAKEVRQAGCPSLGEEIDTTE